MSINTQTYEGYLDVLKKTFSSDQWKQQPTEPIKGAKRPDDVTANYLYGQIYRIASLQEGAIHYGAQENFMFGCLVIASGITRSRDAYRTSCQESGQAESTEELLAALKDPRSSKLPVAIAGMRNSKADIFMGQFGLQLPPTGSLAPFLYNRAEKYIEPNPQAFKQAAIEVAYWAGAHQQSPEIYDDRPTQCPARRFIPMLWNRAIEISLSAGLLEPSVTPVPTSVVR